MQQRRTRRAGAFCALVLATLIAGESLSMAASNPEPADTYAGVTRPSEERALSFSYPGVVKEVLVKEGQKVKAGEALIRLDDRLDRNALEQLEIEANSPLKVEYAVKSRDQKQVRLQRMKEMRELNAASPLELEETELDAELAVTQLKLSEEESQTAKLKAAGQKIKVDLATRTSTIDGVVKAINVKEGEYADPQQSQRPAIVVVRNDPLKVEVFVPVAVAAKLSDGQQLEVAYGETQQDWKKARITYFDPVADAGSGMRRLWLEVPNPENRESGLQVSVRVPTQP